MSQKKVLIIDYDAESLKTLSEFAQGEGCDVVTASDGITGLEKFKAERPDLVVMEAMLPKLHGFELCKKIAYDSAKKVPVIIVTGIYRESVYKSEAIRFYGASAFFEKPWKKEDLQPVFQSLLKGGEQPAPQPAEPESEPEAKAPIAPPAKIKAKTKDFSDEWGLLAPEEEAAESPAESAQKAAEAEAEIDTILQSALADLGLKGGHEEKAEPVKEKPKAPKPPKETPIFTPPPAVEAPRPPVKEHEEKPVDIKPSSAPFGGYIDDSEKKKSKTGLIIGIGAAAVVVVVLFMFVLKPKKTEPGPVAATGQTQQEVLPENQASPDSSASGALPVTSDTEKPADSTPNASQPVTAPQSKPRAVESKPAAKPQGTPATQSGRSSSDSLSPIMPAQTPTLQMQAQIPQPEQKQPQVTPTKAEETPAAPPKAQEGDLIPLGQVDVQPVELKRVPPIYPERARRVGMEGIVTVNALISENGDVIQTVILRGITGSYGFDQAAKTSIGQYKFRPAMKDGIRVKVWKPFNVIFKK